MVGKDERKASMKTPAVYFRRSMQEEEEFEECRRHFLTVEQRSLIPAGSLVIPRYSSLPFFLELEVDIKNMGSALINTYAHHQYCADIQNWYTDLQGLTPTTYFHGWSGLPEGAYVVKGATNSAKHQWNRMMFVPSKKDFSSVVSCLLDNAVIAEQKIVVREYVPLRTYRIGINGLPITNEWRFFVLDGKVLCHGYYWASEPDCIYSATVTPAMWSTLSEAITRIGDKCRFYAIDIAETQQSDGIIIEINDGTMSGISMIPPAEFYSSLKTALKGGSV